MPDASLVDAAVVTVLANDATLHGLCPDGVFWDLANPGATRFVVVSLFDHQDETGLDDADLAERTVYLVKAVALIAGGTLVRDAAARIHELLHRAPALDLSATGYELMAMRRVHRVRYTETDPVEKSSRWQHRGGQYELWTSPAPPA